MIVHVWRRAVEADIGPVVVACADQEIVDAVTEAGGSAVMTRADWPSGSDRVREAVDKVDARGQHDIVVNLQGDLPTLDPVILSSIMRPFSLPDVDITTAVARISSERERSDPNVVKAAVALDDESKTGRALYFSRSLIPAAADGPHYHHIGVYAFRRPALERFVALPMGKLERLERLEQLRALEAGMRINAVLVDTVPLGVDTPADLSRARALLAPGSAF